MKLNKNGQFYKWCKQAPKINDRIDWIALSDEQKDLAVVNYLIDAGTHQEIVMRLMSATCPDWYKEGAYTNCQYVISDLIDLYNDENASLWANDDDYDREPQYRPDQAMEDAGHKWSDF